MMNGVNDMNIIPNIVKQLGLTLNQEFSFIDSSLAENSDNIYMFTETALVYKNGDTWEMSSKLTDILNGNIEISLPPFYPKYGDRYWTISISDFDGNSDEVLKQENWKIYRDTFLNTFAEIVLRDNNLCFRNAEDCRKVLPQIFEKYTGKVWESFEEEVQ